MTQTAERRPAGGGVPKTSTATIPVPVAVVEAVVELIGSQRAREHARYRQGWRDCLDYLAGKIGGRIMPARPTETEIRRWGPGGRAHFADPRPGDFPGRGAA